MSVKRRLLEAFPASTKTPDLAGVISVLCFVGRSATTTQNVLLFLPDFVSFSVSVLCAKAFESVANLFNTHDPEEPTP